MTLEIRGLKIYTVDIKRIILTNHAKKRMKSRHVSMKQVNETITEPDEPYRLGEWNEEIAIKRFDKREIRVIFEETKRDTIIVYSVISKPIKGR